MEIIKIGIIGDKSIGKTNIINVFCDNKFENENKSTNSLNIKKKNINIMNKDYEINFLDVPGQKTFMKSSISLVNPSLGIILVYSINNKNSFHNCRDWINKLNKSIPILLLGNQIDDEEKRIVSKNEGLNFAKRYKFLFFECSAKNNININNAILSFIKHIILKNNPPIILNDNLNPISITILGDKYINKSNITEKLNSNIITYLNEIFFSVNIKILEKDFDSNDSDYFINSSGIILIYSIYNSQSFYKIEKFLEQMKKMPGYNFFFPLILISSQDLIDNKSEIKILFKEGKTLSNNYFIDFFEILTSDKDKLNQIFSYLIKDVILFNHNKFNSKNYNVQINEKDKLTTNLISTINFKKDKHECIGKIIYHNKSIYEGYIILGKKEKKGKMHYNNGIKYKGFWLNDKKNGKGILMYSDKEEYKGNFVNDLKNGLGIYNSLEYFYKGSYKNDKKDGYGEIKYKNGDNYFGNWKNDKKEGKGKMSYKNGIYLMKNNKTKSKKIKCFIYEGNWENDKWNGLGICYLNDNQYLEGNFINNVLVTNNKYVNQNGDEYQGNLIELKRNGFGLMKYKNGDIYIGNWEKNLKNGKGKIIFKDGIFEGTFIKDKKEKGIFCSKHEDYMVIQSSNESFETLFEHQKYDDYMIINKGYENLETLFKNKKIKGIVYEGNLINDNLNGLVTYINGDEYFYFGNYENNKKNGIGKMIYKNGDEYNGNFKNDKREGNGTINFNNGKIYSGIFKNDEIIGDLIFVSEKKIISLTIDDNKNNNIKIYKINKDIKPLNPLKKCIIR